jgi:hypothetical protein
METATQDTLDRASVELRQVVADLGRITGLEVPELFDAEVRRDEPVLFVYGLLGGKDVGKTTLINALAEAKISIESPGISTGTNVPVVYVHHDDVPAVRERLAADVGLDFELRTHDRAVLRQVALVDLPDFDSKRNLPEHARRANQFKRFLDGFVWVTTVRKIDHPELLRQMASVAPKQENFYCVVTFADEVIHGGKDTLSGLRQLCLDRVRRLYFADFAVENLYVICTLDARSYDFPGLRARLVRSHSAEEIVHRRRRSVCRALRANIDRVTTHFRLDDTIATLDRLLAELPDRFDENFPAEYWTEVADRVARLDGPYRRMTARLFSHRIWGWPILSVLMFPMSAIVSYLGGRLFFDSGTRWTDYHQLPEILTIDALSLRVRFDRVAIELRAKYLRLHQEFHELVGGEPDTDGLLRQWSDGLDENDRATTAALERHYRRPPFWLRWLVYLPLVWFPFVQPVLETYLRQPELRASGFFRGVALTAVSLLSARYVLQSAAVLLVIYTSWLLGFYASSARQIARRRLADFAALRRSQLFPQLMAELSARFEHLRDLLRSHADRLARLRGELVE